jgi:nitrite reductase (NADH) large subunit
MGSQVCRLNLPGTHLKGIYTFHQRSDVEQLLNRRKDSHRIAVLGGGVLGLEIACALHRDGTEVCIVQPERLMVRQLDARASSMVLEQMHALGIPVILDRAKEILGKDTVTGLRTYSGEVLECNIIVLATGVQPRVELAVGAGLRVGRGIKVNDRMQSSDPAIYAVGECAEHRGRVYGLVGPGYEQAAVAAQNIVGNQATYEASVVVTLLKGIDLPVVTIGRMEVDPPSPKEVIYKPAKDKVYRKLMLHRGRLIGIQAIGDLKSSIFNNYGS